MEIVDEDGDTLDVHEVFGFGERSFVVSVTQDSDVSAVRLTAAQVEELAEFLRRMTL